MNRSTMEEAFAEHQSAVEAARREIALLERIADRISECFAGGGRLYLFGNGGSAADAQHIAAELVGRFKKNRRALAAVALTTDTSTLTAISNDLAFEQVFSRQIEALVTDRDIVWALSVSGRSPNVLRAVEVARQLGAFVIGFTGRNGDALAERCDLCFRADHTQSDRVQEIHQLAYHQVCEAVESRFA